MSLIIYSVWLNNHLAKTAGNIIPVSLSIQNHSLARVADTILILQIKTI